MRDSFGYKVLRTYQQGIEIHELTKKFTNTYLDPLKDGRLISHMDDSGRSIPRNIAEGYGRNNAKQYYEFLGFAFGSLMELLEDFLELEKEIKGGQRKTKDNNGILDIISRAIKLCMGEKTMLKNQMEKMEKMVGEEGLISQNRRIAKALTEGRRKELQFDHWIEGLLKKNKNN